MKLRLWILLITLLLPSSAFANSCASRLKNKNYEKTKKQEVISVAIGTHKPTKETKWIDCNRGPYAAGEMLYCGEKKFATLFYLSTKSGWDVLNIFDRLDRPASLNSKGKWNKSFCAQRENWYTDTQQNFYKFYLKEAGGKFLFKWEKKQRYEIYDFIF